MWMWYLHFVTFTKCRLEYMSVKHITLLNGGVKIILDLPYDSHRFLLPLLLKIPFLEAQLMNRFAKMCKTMYFSEYKFVSFLFRLCMELANSLMGLFLYYYYYYHLFVFKIIRTVVQLFTSVDKSNYKVHSQLSTKYMSTVRFKGNGNLKVSIFIQYTVYG